MRSIKDMLITLGLRHDYSDQYSGDEIIELIGGLEEDGYFQLAPDFGERAYKAIGKEKTVIIWDCGNDSYQIITES